MKNDLSFLFQTILALAVAFSVDAAADDSTASAASQKPETAVGGSDVADSNSNTDSVIVKTGRLIIKTNPDSATVTINKTDYGFSPVTVEKLPAGEHVIFLKKDGYFTKKAVVSMPADTVVELAFELTKQIDRVISTVPSGASLLIDEKIKGTTPFNWNKTKPGKHQIVLSLNGFETKNESVLLDENGNDTLVYELTAIAPDKSKDKTETSTEVKKTRQKTANRIAIGIFLALTLVIVIIELADMND
jgi:hypothetical protein